MTVEDFWGGFIFSMLTIPFCFILGYAMELTIGLLTRLLGHSQKFKLLGVIIGASIWAAILFGSFFFLEEMVEFLYWILDD